MRSSSGLSRELRVDMKISTWLLAELFFLEAAADKLSVLLCLCSLCWCLQSKFSLVVRSRNSTNIPARAATVRCPAPSLSRRPTATAPVRIDQKHTWRHTRTPHSDHTTRRANCAGSDPCTSRTVRVVLRLVRANLLERNINCQENFSAESNLLNLVLIRSVSLSQMCQSLPVFTQTSKLLNPPRPP